MSPNFITSDFSACCQAAQVQCCITSDPRDYKKLYQFKCLGDYGVEITHGKTQLTSSTPATSSN